MRNMKRERAEGNALINIMRSGGWYAGRFEGVIKGILYISLSSGIYLICTDKGHQTIGWEVVKGLKVLCL